MYHVLLGFAVQRHSRTYRDEFHEVPPNHRWHTVLAKLNTHDTSILLHERQPHTTSESEHTSLERKYIEKSRTLHHHSNKTHAYTRATSQNHPAETQAQPLYHRKVPTQTKGPHQVAPTPWPIHERLKKYELVAVCIQHHEFIANNLSRTLICGT
ncbi:unnamed protein product [Ectocarpus sp. 12 AP-2014]